MASNLPDWLSQNEKGVFVVDADTVYPKVLAALGFKEVDQYALETVMQCTKMKVQDLVEALGVDPRPEKCLIIDIKTSDKARWAIANAPVGKGAAAATQGREAREHYKRIKGKF